MLPLLTQERHQGWPECLNCNEPAAEYKLKPNKPRLYCSDECLDEYNQFYKSYGGRKRVRDLVPHWPLCLSCGERPRAAWVDKHGYPAHSESVKAFRKQRREAQEACIPFEATLLYKFCSTNCREDYVAHLRGLLNHLHDVDDLSSFLA